MRKEEIYVVIDSEEKRLRALDILERAGEKVFRNSFLKKEVDTEYKFLRYIENYNCWMMSIPTGDGKNTTLDQLDKLLNPNYQVKEIILPLDELKSQANALGYELVEKKREIKVGDFGVFWDGSGKFKVFDFLYEKHEGVFIDGDDVFYENFRHLTEEEKQKIQNKW